MSAHTAAQLAWWLCAVSLAMMTAHLVVVVLAGTAALPPGFPQPGVQAVEAIGFLGAPILGAVIAAHRPENAYGWLWCAIGLSLGVTFLAVGYGAYTLVVEPGALPGGLVAAWVSSVATALVLGLLPFVFLMFPNGRLLSGRWRPLAWTAGLVGVAQVVLRAVDPGPIYDFPFVDNPIRFAGAAGELVEWLFLSEIDTVVWLGFIVTLALSAVSMAVRFRRARGRERQQHKWFASVSVALIAFFVADVFVSGWESRLLDAVVAAVLFSAMYAAIGIAVLKHHLYDIDRLLNRTLVYGLLTAILGLGYAGVVLGLGRLFGGVTSERPTWVVAAATLAVAALFQPARRRIQAAVDRRFNRRRYHAVKTVEAFSARLRNEIDLDTLTAELLAVAEQTMEPTRVSLWLRPSMERSGRFLY